MSKKLKNLRLRIFLSFIVFLGAVLLPMEEPIQLVLYLASYLIVGGDIIKKLSQTLDMGKYSMKIS